MIMGLHGIQIKDLSAVTTSLLHSKQTDNNVLEQLHCLCHYRPAECEIPTNCGLKSSSNKRLTAEMLKAALPSVHCMMSYILVRDFILALQIGVSNTFQ